MQDPWRDITATRTPDRQLAGPVEAPAIEMKTRKTTAFTVIALFAIVVGAFALVVGLILIGMGWVVLQLRRSSAVLA